MDATPSGHLIPAALGAYGGGWAARLSARVARRAGRSVIGQLEHHGPLRLQKALWPEGPEVAHLILLHPPGGIAGGDVLSIAIDVEGSAHAFVTTPGAGHWYRADAPAAQHVRLAVAAGGMLEWLPQETIVHDGTLADARIDVVLEDGAAAIGCEVTVLGRRASGERFRHGALSQRLHIRHAGELLLDEHARLQGDALDDPATLAGRHVTGLLWAVGRESLADTLAEQAEAAMQRQGVDFHGASCIDGRLFLARVVDGSPERARRALLGAWAVLRPKLMGRDAQPPRIWAT